MNFIAESHVVAAKLFKDERDSLHEEKEVLRNHNRNDVEALRKCTIWGSTKGHFEGQGTAELPRNDDFVASPERSREIHEEDQSRAIVLDKSQ
ncbi:hypothetical protein MLD38_000170 [Melastoma candidum]|uniref:Uncharacterized protein n=1 Tax=Melastoma candidum TaxID=119954 RepID=A0ACB9S9C8_9MYRT|nr:hypothetical protein MLD38_000170 [Melastoma candidum]